MGSKSSADILYETLDFSNEISVIHAKKEQNHRVKSIERFESGESRILIATDVIARGIDIDNISTVISFNTPLYPENYIHRIGRTGRAGQEGSAILLYSEQEAANKDAIEQLMNYTIPFNELPEDVTIATELIPEEKPKVDLEEEDPHEREFLETGASFHDKKDKNKKTNQKESYQQQLKKKYKKPIRRGDKIQNLKSKRKKK
jgi:ATP-dependent RNA helicase RhlE